jgi:hypothetical protein
MVFQIHKVIISFGFEVNLVDNCIYHEFGGSKYIFLVLYVDDKAINHVIPLWLRETSLVSKKKKKRCPMSNFKKK